MNDLYEDNRVRLRIIEYLGGHSVRDATAVYLMESDFANPESLNFRPVDQIDYYLDARRDIARSLWDRQSIVAHLDIEYVNFDYKAEPYLDMERSFSLQQPVVDTVERILLEYGISPLHLISGRGHHFVWRVRRESATFLRIRSAARLPDTLKGINAELHEPVNEPVPADTGEAFAGLGLAMEHLAYRIKEEAAPRSGIPVELTDVFVGPGERGREMISIDISEYGDPLHTRMIRIPFTVYRKPWEKGIADDPSVSERIPLLFMIPLHEMCMEEAPAVMRDIGKLRDLASRASTSIPEASDGMGRLLDDYLVSSTKRFHDWFYSQEHEPPPRWPDTYDRMPMESLPDCARAILSYPNEALLQPACLQFVTRSLLSLGWHPRHIAGFVRSKYERDFGWGSYWYRYDASMRADFYTRIFTGLFVTGRDDLVSFNCRSAQEMGICSFPYPGCEVDRYRDSLLARRAYERLACGPFNRLFLP